MSKITTKESNSSDIIPFKKIIWKDANKVLPKLKSARWHNRRHSNRVLVLAGFNHSKATFEYRFATYVKEYGWSVEGMSGEVKVVAWAYLSNKLKNHFNSK